MCILKGRAGYYRLPPVIRVTGLILILNFVCHAALAHPELQLQIDQLTAQLELEPDNVDLLLKRGDLHRRHDSADLARTDFNRVREIQPENQTVDWFEGRLGVQTGDPREGVRYLDRFLLNNPGHVIALQNRAEGYWLLNQPLLAAKDFQTVIRESDNPAPSVYASCALAYIAAGSNYYSAALDIVKKGLSLFPGEVTLTAFATDLSLARLEVEGADIFINSLPAAVLKLPQWQTRIALLECEAGNMASASEWFSSYPVAPLRSQFSSGLLSEKWLARLATDPSADNCQAAAIEILNSHGR